MRKKIIIGNWKMYKNNAETKAFIDILTTKLLGKKILYDFGIAASYTNLLTLKTNKITNFIVAAQNCSSELQGAFTGEISLSMLKDFAVSYVIVAHSERRQYFNETDAIINKKLHTIATNSQLIPILCCGETLSEYENHQTEAVITSQITAALKNLSAAFVKKMVIAYEPIWAIGTGKTASAALAQMICKSIRNVIEKLYDQNIANEIRIQYGGSVNPSNVKQFLQQPDIDGALVGSAALDPATFATLIL